MKKKILIVEDEREIREDIVLTLRFNDYDAYEASDGLEAIQIVNDIKPDLIISDIMMPEMDGFELLKELQKNPDTDMIPFLFLTAKTDIREGMNLGADDYMTKPFDIDQLLRAVEIRLKKQDAIIGKYKQKIEEFSSNISKSLPHEIRTPLGTILGFSEFLMKKFRKTDPDEVKEMLRNIYDSGKRLNRLFENYLFYADLELIKSNDKALKDMKKHSTDYPSVLAEDKITFHPDYNERKEDIFKKIENVKINISDTNFAKIVEEIFDNAIKFSERGSSITIIGKPAGEFFELVVHDEGRGMTEDQINNVGAYTQFERNMYEQQGSGLGLAIVKRLAELYGGNLQIESTVDAYTKVTVRIPLLD